VRNAFVAGGAVDVGEEVLPDGSAGKLASGVPDSVPVGTAGVMVEVMFGVGEGDGEGVFVGNTSSGR